MEDRLYAWGGMKKDVHGIFAPIREDIVFAYDLDPSSFNDGAVTGTWSRIKATGEIHPGFISATATADDNFIYIFGGAGVENNNMACTNQLTILSKFGLFKRLNPSGAIPSPRRDHCSWSYNGDHYHFGGMLQDRSYSNDLTKYSAQNNEFTSVKTETNGPTPRRSCAVARLEEVVYLHGGHRDRVHLRDFMALDMTTLQWTRILDTGFTVGVSDHTISRVSEKEILLIGGNLGSAVSNRLMVFNVDDESWQEQGCLPPDLVGAEGGLKYHRTVDITTDSGIFVVCIGGNIDVAQEKYAEAMPIFQFSP